MAPPLLAAELLWSSDLQFGATIGPQALVVDGDGVAGPSPMQLLAVALSGCMSTDVVAILQKGRHPLTAFRASLSAERAAAPPRRLLTIALHFHIAGDVPAAAVERAIALSRERYCSVWHSMRGDVPFTTTYDVRPSDPERTGA
jgi:putative redox protein